MASKEDFVTQLRASVTKILSGMGDAKELLDHYTGLGYSDSANFESEDFQGVHPDITRADVVAAVGSIDALNTFLAGGHRTNLERVRRL